MKIVQMLPTIDFGDAVGNDVLALSRRISEMGYETETYAVNISPKIARNYPIIPALPFPKLQSNDILIYHLSIGSPLHSDICKADCRKIAVYHNITPSFFFKKYNALTYRLCDEGLEEIKQLNNTFEYCFADSEFNKQDLIRYGYTCPIDILPILIPFKDYNKKSSDAIICKYSGEADNILFIGRIAPNKKIEDVIASFKCYKQNYKRDARLFLVGNYDETDLYYLQLVKYVKLLGVKDVIFTGRIPFDEILAYYSIADVFLCMSEHEGFCVPLVESMYFDVPIIAYASSAIPDTLGGSGILLKEKSPLLTAGVINRVLNDKDLRQRIIARQQRRLSDFDEAKVTSLFKHYIESFLKRGI